MSGVGRKGLVSGVLDVGDGQRLAFGVHGRPGGRPVVVVHGGPGSGAGPAWLELFDLDRDRVVLFDQRGCGQSTPTAADPATDLSVNTTAHLVADIERLRRHLDIDRWLVVGASWGATLAQAYLQAHPDHVSAAVLFAVTTTSRREVDWITVDMRRLLPAAWEDFHAAAEPRPGERLVEAYARLLADPDPHVRDDAALAWCRWEDTHSTAGRHTHESLGRRLADGDPAFRYGFARLVTHYWRHDGFLPDGALLAGAHHLAGVPAVLVHGTRDLSSPPDIAYDLARAWPGAQLHLVDSTHSGPVLTDTVRAAITRLADQKNHR